MTEAKIEAKIELSDKATPELDKFEAKLVELDAEILKFKREIERDGGQPSGPPLAWLLTAIAVALLGIALAWFLAGRL